MGLEIRLFDDPKRMNLRQLYIFFFKKKNRSHNPSSSVLPVIGILEVSGLELLRCMI
jgi:hypothetical protein